MPTSINLGKIRPVDKGEWSSTYEGGYDILDIVTSGKGSYMSKVKPNTFALTDRTKWIPLVDSAAIELAIQEAMDAAGAADAARLAIEGELALKQDKIDAGLETTSKNVVGAINEVNRIVSIHHADNKAVRRWNNTLSTPIGEAVGDLDFLRELPRILGLGCYLVADDLTKKKLHRDNHNFYEDGSPALLDGSEGQYMFCWGAFYFTTWEEYKNARG